MNYEVNRNELDPRYLTDRELIEAQQEAERLLMEINAFRTAVLIERTRRWERTQ